MSSDTQILLAKQRESLALKRSLSTNPKALGNDGKGRKSRISNLFRKTTREESAKIQANFPLITINSGTILESVNEDDDKTTLKARSNPPINSTRLTLRTGRKHKSFPFTEKIPTITRTNVSPLNKIFSMIESFKPNYPVGFSSNCQFSPKSFSESFADDFFNNFGILIEQPRLRFERHDKVSCPDVIIDHIIQHGDELLRDLFLSTYRLYMTDEEVLQLLWIKLHNFQMDGVSHKVYYILCEWLEVHVKDRSYLFQLLSPESKIYPENDFIKVVRLGLSQPSNYEKRKKYLFQKVTKKKLKLLHRSIFQQSSNHMAEYLHIYYIHIIWSSSNNGDPENLVVQYLENSIQKNELSHVTNFSKSLSAWISMIILNELSPYRRTILIEFFVDIATIAYEQHKNFELAFAIGNGIKSSESIYSQDIINGSSTVADNFLEPSVFQSQKTILRYEQLNSLINPETQYDCYRRLFSERYEGAIPSYGKSDDHSYLILL